MSELLHAKCGGAVMAVSVINFQILTFTINNNKLQTGATQAENPIKGTKGTSLPINWVCSQCRKVFDKESFVQEVEVSCRFCSETHPITEAVYTTFTPFSGKSCLEDFHKRNPEMLPSELRIMPLLPLLLENKIIA